jgi:hypothetical protein
MFAPFETATLGPVLAKVAKDRRGRSVRIAYADPTHDAVFREQPWLERHDFWPEDRTRMEYSVSLFSEQLVDVATTNSAHTWLPAG